MLISVAFQQMYNIADSVIAGRFIGEDALAAVGASYPITMIFMAIAIGSCAGCAVIISRLFGGRQYIHLKCAVSTIFITCVVLSVVLTVFGVWQGQNMLRMLQTPENIFADGALYLNIYIYGFLFLFLYNVCTGIFTALGDSKTPLYFLIGSSVGNILLDLLFVIVFDMGRRGMGNLRGTGHFLPAGTGSPAPSSETDSHHKTVPAVFFPFAGADFCHCRTQHFAAELRFRGEPVHPGFGQQLWLRRYCGIFFRHQAEYILCHLYVHPCQRTFFLYGTEYRRP